MVALSFAATGCGPAAIEDDVLTRIEEEIELPEGAAPLDIYSRYYAHGDQGAILAVYVIHPEGYSERVIEACSAIEDGPFPCPVNGGPLRLADAGKRVWVDNVIDLPGMSGGGCAQINVEFHPGTNTFATVECNGPY